jgi:hypothetical protein
LIIWSARQGNARVPPGFIERFTDDRNGLIDDLVRKIRERAGV